MPRPCDVILGLISFRVMAYTIGHHGHMLLIHLDKITYSHNGYMYTATTAIFEHMDMAIKNSIQRLILV